MLNSLPQERDLRGKAWVFVLFNLFTAWVIIFGLFAACLIRSAREHSVSGISTLSAMQKNRQYRLLQDIRILGHESPSLQLTVQGVNINYHYPFSFYYNNDNNQNNPNYFNFNETLQQVFVIKNPSVAETYKVDDQPYLSILLLWIVASIIMLIVKMLPIHTRVNPLTRRVLTSLFAGCVVLTVCLLFAVYFIISAYPNYTSENRFDKAYEATLTFFQNDTIKFVTPIKLYYGDSNYYRPFLLFQNPCHFSFKNQDYYYFFYYGYYYYNYGYYKSIKQWYFYNRIVLWDTKNFMYMYCNVSYMQSITNQSLPQRLWQGRRTIIQKNKQNSLYNDYKYEIDILTELEEKYRCAGWSYPTNGTIFTRGGIYESSYTCKSILIRNRDFELIVFGYGSIVFLPLFIFAFCYYTHLTKK